MIILTIRTDKTEAEVGLFEDDKQLAYEVWSARRQLAESLHRKIQAVLDSQHKTIQDIAGIICYKGPGSFTGLRIGLSVANALAYGLKVPIVGIDNPENWLSRGLYRMQVNDDDQRVIPVYGAPVHITLQRK